MKTQLIEDTILAMRQAIIQVFFWGCLTGLVIGVLIGRYLINGHHYQSKKTSPPKEGLFTISDYRDASSFTATMAANKSEAIISQVLREVSRLSCKESRLPKGNRADRMILSSIVLLWLDDEFDSLLRQGFGVALGSLRPLQSVRNAGKQIPKKVEIIRIKPLRCMAAPNPQLKSCQLTHNALISDNMANSV